LIGHVLALGLAGLLIGAWAGDAELALTWMLMGAILGYALALGRKVKRLHQQVMHLKAARAAPESTAEPTGEEPPPAQAEEPLSVDWPPAPGEAHPHPQAPPTRQPLPPVFGPRPETRGPALPGPLSEAAAAVRVWISRGNPIVQIGTLVLFFGVAFLVSYAAERDLVPLELRLASVALGGLVLLIVGWRLRRRTGIYATVLQGAGIGVIYLTIYAAAKLYGLIPPAIALWLMVAAVVCAGILAVLQDALALALFGTIGGFLAPILATSGSGSHVTLFSYYALLNLGVLGIGWFRAWRLLNLAGFLFTFVIGGIWGYQFYRPELFASTEPFLILFFLIYVVIAVLYAQRQETGLRGYVDGTLVFGMPLVAFGLQAALVRDFPHGLAWSAVAFGAFYLGITALLWKRRQTHLRLLTESFLALGVAFVTLAIPLALEGRWTATAWSLEGAAMVWAGVRQGRRLPRASGVLLQLGGGLALLLAEAPPRILPILNGTFLSALMVAAAGLFSAWYLQSKRTDLARWERAFALPLMLWGIAWWLGAGLNEIDWYLMGREEGDASLAFVTFTAVVAGRTGSRLAWRELALAAAGLLPILVLAALDQMTASSDQHPLGGWGGLAWPLALISHYWILRHLGASWPARMVRLWHPLGLWLVLLLASRELGWLIDHRLHAALAWRYIGWALFPGLALAVLWRYGRFVRWPVRAHFSAYAVSGTAPVAIYLFLWTIGASRLPGLTGLLHYLPVLNPLDLAQLLALAALARWCRWLSRSHEQPPWWPKSAVWIGALAAAGFLWLNTLVARSVHYWGGIGYTIWALHHSVVFQTSVSILWTLTALPLMVFANRRGVRKPWLAGAALLAVVVLKLFLVDLSGVGTLARIVSFLAVGGLMLLIGYLAPLPPRQQETRP
jgi:uncharacterized membrane protein